MSRLLKKAILAITIATLTPSVFSEEKPVPEAQKKFIDRVAKTGTIFNEDGSISFPKEVTGFLVHLFQSTEKQPLFNSLQNMGVNKKLNDPNKKVTQKKGYVGATTEVIDIASALQRESFYGIQINGDAQSGKTRLVNSVSAHIDNVGLEDTFFLPMTTFDWKDNAILGVIENFFTNSLGKVVEEAEKTYGSKKLVIHLSDFSNLLDCKMSEEVCRNVVKKFENEFLNFENSAYAGKVKFIFEVDSSLANQFEQLAPRIAARLHKVDIKTPTAQEILNELKKISIEIPFENDDVFLKLIDSSTNLFPKQAPLQAAKSALEDIQLKALEDNVGEITNSFLFDVTQERLGLPFDPQNPQSREDFRQEMIAYLSSKVMNQDHAINEVVEAVIEFYSNPKLKVFPIMLMGSTGIGKTYLIELLAEKLFDKDSLSMDIAGSQFLTDDNRDLAASTLVGSATSTEPGKLTAFLDKIQGKGGVLLLDEFEKFAKYYHLMFMQLFDKGVLMAPDGAHYATKLIVFLGTNKGVDEIYEGGDVYNVSHLKEAQLKKFFTLSTGVQAKEGEVPDEIIGRIGKWVALNQHEAKHAIQIMYKELEPVLEMFAQKNYEVHFSENLVAAMVLDIFSPRYGVRDIGKLAEKFRSMVYEVIRQAELPPGSAVPLDIEPIDGTADSKILYIGENKEKVTFDGPKLRSVDPRNDRVIGTTVSTLENTPVPFQEEIWGDIVERYKTHRLGGLKTPFTFFLVADASKEVPLKFSNVLSGKAIDDRTLLMEENHIDLSQIVSEQDFYSLIGSPASIQGAKNKSKLQRLLDSKEDGGVILFTNFDKMGDAGPMLLKKLTPYITGNRVSFPNGQSYELANKVIAFSTTSGAENYAIINDETYRNKLWKKDTKTSKQELIGDSGAPKILIDRSFAYVSKPMSTAESIVLGKTLLAELEAQFDVSIETDDSFWEKMSTIFYNPDFADERILQLFKQDLANLLTKAGILLDSDLPNTYDPLRKASKGLSTDATMKLTLSDDAYEESEFWTDWQESTFDGRTTTLNLSIKNSDKTKLLEEDVSSTAIPFAFNRKVSKELVSKHEIGHALTVAIPTLNGVPPGLMEHTTIKPVRLKSFNAAGVAFSTPILASTSQHPRSVRIDDLSTVAAGAVAEWLRNGRPTEGWSSDREKINRASESTIVTNRVVEANSKQEQQSENLKVQIEIEKERMMMEAYLAALSKIQHNFFYWKKASKVLEQKESISQELFFKIGNDQFDNEFPLPDNSDELDDCVKLFL